MNNYHSNFNAMDITVELVKSLIASQFPQFQSLDIYPVEKSGHDNRTFHLGDNMTVRLPSGEGYAVQVEKESKWLPYLSRHLDFPISKPLYRGDPACDYAMAWTYFSSEERKYFLKGLPEDMIDRARGWALWKALITYDDENIDFKTNAHSTIVEILKESEERNR